MICIILARIQSLSVSNTIYTAILFSFLHYIFLFPIVIYFLIEIATCIHWAQYVLNLLFNYCILQYRDVLVVFIRCRQCEFQVKYYFCSHRLIEWDLFILNICVFSLNKCFNSVKKYDILRRYHFVQKTHTFKKTQNFLFHRLVLLLKIFSTSGMQNWV